MTAGVLKGLEGNEKKKEEEKWKTQPTSSPPTNNSVIKFESVAKK